MNDSNPQKGCTVNSLARKMVSWALCTVLLVVAQKQLWAQIPNIGGLIQKGIQKKVAAQQAVAAEKQRQSLEAPLVGFNTGNRYALLIPVEKFDNPDLRSLPNLLRLSETLRQHLVQGGFAAEDVEILGQPTSGDRTVPARSAQTLRQIRSSIDKLLKQVQPEDMLMVYLIGHGFGLQSDDTFRSYFCASDTTAAAVTDREKAEQQALSLDQLVQQLRDCKAQEKILVVDACQNDERPFNFRLEPTTTERGDVWVVSSCSPGEVSRCVTFDTELYPCFSWHFARAISWTDHYDDDGDGYVTLREAFNRARQETVRQRDNGLLQSGWDLRRATNENQRQQPVIRVGLGLMPLVRVPSVLPASQVISGSLEEEQQIAATAMARTAAQILQRAEEVYSKKFAEVAPDAQAQTQQPTTPLPEDGYALLAGYAVGSYLKTAQQLSPNTRDEILFYARHFRSTGQYERALAKYRAAGIEELEVFANGRIPTTDLIYGRADVSERDTGSSFGENAKDAEVLKTAAPGLDREKLIQQIGSVPVCAEAGGPEIGEIPASTKLFISETMMEPATDIVWLKISRSELNNDANAGRWIRAENVHWCREASLLFVEGSDLIRDVASIIGSQVRNAELVLSGPSFQAELQRLRAAQAKLARLRRILINTPWTSQAAGWLGFAEGIVAMVENSKARNVRNSYQRYQTTKAYDLEAKRLAMGKYEKMLKIDGGTAEIPQERVKITNSPWAARKTP